MNSATILLVGLAVFTTLFLESSAVPAESATIALTGPFANAVEKARKFAGDVIRDVATDVKTAVDKVGKNISEAAENVQKNVQEKVAKDIKTVTENIHNTVKNVQESVHKAVKNVQEEAVKDIKTVTENVKKTVKNIHDKAVKDIETVKDTAAQFASDAKAKFAVDALKTLLAGVKVAVDKASDAASGDVKDGLTQIRDWLDGFEDFIASVQ